MQYSAAGDVFIVENTENYGTNWLSVKVTAVMVVNTVVLDIGMGLELSKLNAIFFLLYFRSLNIRIHFNIIFPSNSSSKYFYKYLIISLIISLPSPPSHPPYHPPLPTPPFPSHPLYPITLTQSAVNSQYT